MAPYPGCFRLWRADPPEWHVARRIVSLIVHNLSNGEHSPKFPHASRTVQLGPWYEVRDTVSKIGIGAAIERGRFALLITAMAAACLAAGGAAYALSMIFLGT